MNKQDRHFTLKLANKELKNGKVSVRLLTKTLHNLQKAVYDLGNSRVNREVVIKGRHPSVVERSCELFLIKAEPGSITATLAFPPKEYDLASELPDLSDNVMSDLKEIFSIIEKRDRNKLVDTIKDQGWRKKVLTSLYKVIPSEKDDYSLMIRFNDKEPFRTYKRPSDEEMALLIGDMLPVDYSVTKGLPEVTVEEETDIKAYCKAKISDDGEVTVTKVIDYELLDTRPYRADTIIWGNEMFMLRNEIACSFKIENDYYVIEYGPLNLFVYGKTREEAIEGFREEIAMLWHAYAMENDDNLTRDAIELKQKILKLIEGVQVVGNFENEGYKKKPDI